MGAMSRRLQFSLKWLLVAKVVACLAALAVGCCGAFFVALIPLYVAGSPMRPSPMTVQAHMAAAAIAWGWVLFFGCVASLDVRRDRLGFGLLFFGALAIGAVLPALLLSLFALYALFVR